MTKPEIGSDPINPNDQAIDDDDDELDQPELGDDDDAPTDHADNDIPDDQENQPDPNVETFNE